MTWRKLAIYRNEDEPLDVAIDSEINKNKSISLP